MKYADIPMALTRSRLVLGPLVLLAAIAHAPAWCIGAALVSGLLSDIFDGVIARKLKIVTAELRVADSRADGIYTFSVVAAICLREPAAIVRHWPGIALIAALEALTTAYDLRKYGRPCSHHAYTAKLWAASLFALAYAALIRHTLEPYLTVCIAFGLVNNIEGYIIRALLPEWTHDVSGIPAALRLSRIRRQTPEGRTGS